MSTINQTDSANVEPLVVRPREARRMLGGCSHDELNRKIKARELESYLDGRRRLITVASIKQDIKRQVDAAAVTGFVRARGSRAPGRRNAVPGAPT